MPFTQQQQDQIDGAQKRLDTAKSVWALWTERWNRDVYNRGFSGMRCYEGEIFGIDAAADWFSLTEPSCGNNNNYNECKIGKGGKDDCKDNVRRINTEYIPPIRAALQELKNAQTNYNNVLASIEQQVQNDPDLIAELEQIQADAEQAGMTTRTKLWVFGGIAIAVIILGIIVIRRFR